jgi:aldehyde dehydrogenase (NAD+)
VDPVVPHRIAVINPATEEVFTEISGGSAADVDIAVAAARAAFPGFVRTTPKERMELLKTILAIRPAGRGVAGDCGVAGVELPQS